MTSYHSHYLRLGRHPAANQVYLVTSTTHGWRPLFEEFLAARTVIGELRRLQGEARMNCLAFVVMPDHLHCLLELRPPHRLEDVMRLLKGRAARQLNLLRKASGVIWQTGYHDHAVRQEEDLRRIARYVVANPLRAGLVQSIGDYPHWDAAWM